MLAAAGAVLAFAATQDIVVTPWGRDSLRIQAVPAGATVPSELGALLPPPAAAAAVTNGNLTNGNIRAELLPSGLLRVVRVSDGAELLSEVAARQISARPAGGPRSGRADNATLYRVEASFRNAGGERLYGMGQHKHGRLDNVGQDVAGAPGAFLPSNTEVFIPFVVSSRQYGYLFNYPGLGVFAWDSSPGATNWTANAATSFDIWVTTSGDASRETEGSWAAQVLSHYADATGHAPVLPKWATGLWQSKNRYQTQDELLDVVRGYRSRNLSISVIVIDYFSWSPQWVAGDYRFDSTCWPDPEGLIKQLDEWGVKLMVSTYSNFVNNRSTNWPSAKAAGDLFVQDAADGSIITDGFQDSAVYDLFGQAARNFVWSRLRETYVKMGIRVFWQDCDEYCTKLGSAPDSWNKRVYYPSVGTDEAVAAAYPKVLAQTFADGFAADGITDGIQLGRSAWAGSQRYGSALWSGDIGSNWESLKMSIPAGMNAGLSGIPWWTTDVGGYGGSHGRAMNTTDPGDRELMVRWVQFGAFCPLFRIHGYRAPTMAPTCKVCTGFSCDQSHETAAWAYGAEAEVAIAKMISTRNALRPYIDQVMGDAAQTGAPPMRPLWFEFPSDPELTKQSVEDTQFMLGHSYLVAPVTDLGSRSRQVYFPSGSSWKHYFTGAAYSSGWHNVDVPYDTPAVFKRQS
eukprot:TRINITY_DN12358_c0_g1_i1.p1 TRINITY_DN12358_c0_g1~~TRINITY_DN12358_c0_g1_i1.p1  ORF type:complete len:709 (+),score=168.55 TRINITY_DN12358_c0_g1_i1:75-2129(+)